MHDIRESGTAEPMSVNDITQAPLIVGAGDLWAEGTHAKFLEAIRDGNLPTEAFRRWLVQDYLFVSGLTSFQAIAAARSPRPLQKVLLDGLTALNAELTWFEEHAERFSLDLSAPPHPTCRRYVDFLVSNAYTQPCEVLVAMLFGVEAAYLCAWSSLASSPAKQGPYADFINRWSNEHFVAFVRGLERLSHENPHIAQQGSFNEVLRHEREFWRMTWEG